MGCSCSSPGGSVAQGALNDIPPALIMRKLLRTERLVTPATLLSAL
jgi:hypothetical protein